MCMFKYNSSRHIRDEAVYETGWSVRLFGRQSSVIQSKIKEVLTKGDHRRLVNPKAMFASYGSKIQLFHFVFIPTWVSFQNGTFHLLCHLLLFTGILWGRYILPLLLVCRHRRRPGKHCC